MELELWITVGAMTWAVGFMFVMILMRMAGKQDRAARHKQKRMDPLCDVTITRLGGS